MYLAAVCKSTTKIHGENCCVSTAKWLLERVKVLRYTYTAYFHLY